MSKDFFWVEHSIQSNFDKKLGGRKFNWLVVASILKKGCKFSLLI